MSDVIRVYANEVISMMILLWLGLCHELMILLKTVAVAVAVAVSMVHSRLDYVNFVVRDQAQC